MRKTPVRNSTKHEIVPQIKKCSDVIVLTSMGEEQAIDAKEAAGRG